MSARHARFQDSIAKGGLPFLSSQPEVGWTSPPGRRLRVENRVWYKRHRFLLREGTRTSVGGHGGRGRGKEGEGWIDWQTLMALTFICTV